LQQSLRSYSSAKGNDVSTAGQSALTPTQIEAHNRSKAFKAKIAEAAARIADDATVEQLVAEATPLPKEIPAHPTVSNEAMREACEMEFPSANQYGPRIDFIFRTVAKHFGVSYLDMRSARRTYNLVWPRQIAFYLARTLTLRSLPEIGRRMGGRDHTTVLHAVRKIEILLMSDPMLVRTIESLKAYLNCEDTQ